MAHGPSSIHSDKAKTDMREKLGCAIEEVRLH